MDKEQSTDVAARTQKQNNPDSASTVQEAPPHKSLYRHASPLHLPSDISDTLKAPVLPDIDPDSISHEQAHAGITIHIPGSVKMCWGDEIRFIGEKTCHRQRFFIG